MDTALFIKMAIYNMGGPTLASQRLQVSISTVNQWIKKGRIPNLKKAEIVSQESGFGVGLLRPIYS